MIGNIDEVDAGYVAWHIYFASFVEQLGFDSTMHGDRGCGTQRRHGLHEAWQSIGVAADMVDAAEFFNTYCQRGCEIFREFTFAIGKC